MKIVFGFVSRLEFMIGLALNSKRIQLLYTIQ